MSEILANIVVDSIQQNITVGDNQIQFTPDSIALNIFTGAGPVASGSNTNVQFNDNGPLGGSNAFTFNKTTNVVTTTNLTTANLTVSNLANLGSISNVKIQGGTNQFFLQTDGTGNLTWAVYPGNISGNSAPGGANTQIQFNDTGANFGGAAGFTFDKTSNLVNMPGDLIVAGNISGNIANANYAAYAGNVVNASQPNITSLGTLTALTATGTIVANVFSGNANLLTNIPGANVTGFVANANYANLALLANTVYDSAQPNITSVGNLISLNVLGTTSIYEGIENVELIGAQTGTYNFNLLDGSIQYSTANATANLTLNFRGNSTTTANTVIGYGKSITSTYLLTNGSNAYGISNIQIDGSAQTISWASNAIPTFYSNTTQSYTFTIIKTSNTPTFKVLGSTTRYG